MKLPKHARAAIYEAKGKPVEVEIPPGESCRKWQTYALEGNRRRKRRPLDPDALFNRPMIFVESHKRRDGALYAVVRLVDPSVYLAHQQGRAHPEQYTGNLPDALDEASRVPPEFQERLSVRGRQYSLVPQREREEKLKLKQAEKDIEIAKELGKPTKLAEGQRDRAKERLEAADSATRTEEPRPPAREPSAPTEPEPPPLSAERVLRVLRDGDSASDIAVQLGRPTTKLRAIVTALQELRESGEVFCFVDEGEEGEQPICRWRRRPVNELSEAA